MEIPANNEAGASNYIIVSEEIKVDNNLKLSNEVPAIKQLLRGPENLIPHAIKQLERKISTPSTYVFAALSSRIYDENEKGEDKNHKSLHGKEVDSNLGNWQLLTVAHNYSSSLGNDGYFGAAYWNPDMHQVIIVHSGIRNVKVLAAELQNILLNKYMSHINPAITFTDIIINILRQTKPYVQLFFTGHSLGAWLAQITTFTAKYIKRGLVNQRKYALFIAIKDFEEAGYDASAICFDSPGCAGMLQYIQDKLMVRSSPSLINSLNVTTYVAAPNLVNTCNPYVGDMYKIFISFNEYEKSWWDNPMKYVLFTHRIHNIKEVFDKDTGEVGRDKGGNLRMEKVIDWPLLASEEKDTIFVDKIVTLLTAGAPIIIPGLSTLAAAVKVAYSAFSKIQWASEFYKELEDFFVLANKSNNFHVNEKKGNAVIVRGNVLRVVRYKTEGIPDDYKNKRNINVFTQSERQFLEMYKLLIKYKHSPLLFNPTQLFSTALDNHELATIFVNMLEDYVIENKIISSNILPKFIPYVKLMLHTFPLLKSEVKNAHDLLPIKIAHMEFYALASTFPLRSIEILLEFENILDLKGFLHSDANILVTNQLNTFIGIMAIHKIFESFTRHNENCIFLSSTKLFRLGYEGLISFLNATTDKYLLVIEYSDILDKEIVTSLLEKLFPKSEKKYLKVIFVTKENTYQQWSIERNISLSYLKNSCILKKIEVKFADLTESSRKELLAKNVFFQGKPAPLRKILGKNDSELGTVIDPETIVALLTNERIEIGKVPPTLGQIRNCYIDRKLIRKVRIKENVFEAEDIMDLFVISNITKVKLSQLVNGKQVCNFSEGENTTSPTKFVILDGENDETDFKMLCSYSQNNLHWLKKVGNDFIWQSSHGTLSYIRRYIDSDFENIVNVDGIDVLNERFVIIAAEPGMGKSTLLTYLGSESTESEWIIRINLIECKNKLEENIDFTNVDNIIDFLCISNESTLSSKLTKSLVKSRFNGSGDLVLLLDGFDEITLHGQKNVKRLLKTLRETKIKKVIISTGSHLKAALEDVLSTFAYTFQPLSEDDQKEFLKKIWQSASAKQLHQKDSDTEKSHITEKRLKNYIDKLFKFISNSIHDNERKFMQIPLHIKMCAEVFQDGLKHALRFNQFDNCKILFPEGFDIFKLYGRVIQTKYQIYFGKKGVYIDLNDGIRNRNVTRKFRQMHRSLAFNILYPEGSADLLREKLPSEAEKHVMKLVGIVHFINNETMSMHRAFAEYFAADLLAENLKSEENSQAYKITLHFLKMELFESKNEMVKVFLDYHLATEEIHVAAFKGKLDYVRDTTREIAVNTTDILGRSALHYAAQGEYEDIVEDLLTNDANPAATDKLGKNALHYAARYNRGKSVVNCLLDKESSCLRTRDKNACTPIVYAAEQGNWDIVNLLIEKDADTTVFNQEAILFHYIDNPAYNPEPVEGFAYQGASITAKETQDNSPLHIAAQSGNAAMVNFLLEQNANVDVINADEKTPMYYAAQNLGIVESISRENTGFYELNEAQKISLFEYSVHNSHWEIVTLFLEGNINNQYLEHLTGQQKEDMLNFCASSWNFNLIEILVT